LQNKAVLDWMDLDIRVPPENIPFVWCPNPVKLVNRKSCFNIYYQS